jgi:gas vesicle protein
MNINVSDKLIYLGAGCGVGLLLGFLLAPESGEEMRHNLSNKVDDLTSRVQDTVRHSGIGETADQAWRNVMEKGRNIASIGKARLNESIEAGKRKFAESIEDDDLAER